MPTLLTCNLLQVFKPLATRALGTAADQAKYKILVVGGGSAGLSVANQIYDRFKAAGKPLNSCDVAILDAASYHFYQPGWTLVGSGLRPRSDFRKNMDSLIPKHIVHVPENVKAFTPNSSYVITTSGRKISYDILVVATGLQINWNKVKGLPAALADPTTGVSSIYSNETCEKVWTDIKALRNGNAIFTQPAGVIRCAGGEQYLFTLLCTTDFSISAPQKIMWMAWDIFRLTNRGEYIKVDFYTGMPTMFSVKKYSDALNELRIQRGVGGHFQHNLIAIDSANHKATFETVNGSTTEVDYTSLHVVPPMGPLEVIKNSPIADSAGWVDVNPSNLRHNKFDNIFALGDCSSLPTSKTAAAITAQAPVLTENLFSVVDTGKLAPKATYDGYTSCPLLTGFGELMLAEFKYGLEPKESFADSVDQSKPNSFFYWLKAYFFPWAYWKYMVKGRWFGSNGLERPDFS